MPFNNTPPGIEIIDADELAHRLSVPRTWIREHTRVRATDPIPHIKLGRYVRFEWGSDELNAWIANRRRGSNVAKVVSISARERERESGNNPSRERDDDERDNDGDAA